MGKYIHWFDKIRDFEKEYWGDDYKNPWVSYTEEDQAIHFEREEEVAKWKQPLTFEILSSGTIGWKASVPSDGTSLLTTLNYRINGGTWKTITATTSGVTFGVREGDIIEFKADNSKYSIIKSRSISSSVDSDSATATKNFFTSTCSFNVSGNITSLLNSTNYNVPELTENGAFAFLFENCTKLVDASKLKLNCTTLSENAYAFMFSGCTALTKAPQLPALTVPTCGYWRMFSGCSKLTVGPELPATTLSDYSYLRMFNNCYRLIKTTASLPAISIPYCGYTYMFYNCTDLTNAPLITATTVGERGCEGMFQECSSLTNVPDLSLINLGKWACYQMFSECSSLVNAPRIPASVSQVGTTYGYMFQKCSSLQVAPELPGTTLSQLCYVGMFENCTSLVNAPALPAQYMESECYCGMFRNCTSLTSAPELNSTALANKCYSQMFAGCTSLTSAPNLIASVLFDRCYESMFEGCSGITNLPIVSATVLANYCYNSMFKNCTSLTTISSNYLPITTLSDYCYYGMFSGCSNMTTLPNLPATTLTTYCYGNMFVGTNITSIASDYLPATDLANYCYSGMFQDCKALTNTPELPATTLYKNCYQAMFSGCSSLNTTTDLNATTLAEYCYSEMFKESALTTTPALSATNLATYCYNGMFKNCKSLTTIKNLPATTLVSNCYNEMFYGCESIETIPNNMLPATNLATYCYYRMFYQCTNLKNVPQNLLPATTLSTYCYSYMFYQCRNLEYAPDLLSTAPSSNAYSYMFNGCYKLKYVKCLAENINGGTNITNSWLSGVANDGIFVKSSNANWLNTASGIPTTWESVSQVWTKDRYFEVNSQINTLTALITATANWTITSNSDWLSSNVSSGYVGDTTITINVGQNQSDTRTGTLTVSTGSESFNIKIYQFRSEFDNLTRLPELSLASNEYVDVGLINPTNILDANQKPVGYLRVDFKNNSVLLDENTAIFWLDENKEGSTRESMACVSTTQDVIFCYWDNDRGTMTRGWNSWSSDGSNLGYNSSYFSMDLATRQLLVKSGGYSYEKRWTLWESLLNQETEVRIGGICGKFKGAIESPYHGVTEPILSIKINPYLAEYHDTPITLYPYVNNTTGKKIFASDNYEKVLEVKTCVPVD